MASRTRNTRKKKSSPAARAITVLFLLALVAAAAAAWLVLTPFGPSSQTLVEITPGSSVMHIGRQLEDAGIVRSRYAIYLLRWLKPRMLRAGEYRFDHPAPAEEVYNRIARGDVYTIALTIPEGANIFDIAARAEQAGLCTHREFLDAAASQVSLIADLDPGARSLEGYLFPDTYKFSPPASAAEMVAAMVHRFRVVAAQLGLHQDVHQVVTMASLVERETAVNAERPLVASVYTNRLAKNMPLMADPSVIYGLELEGRWRGSIYQSDLALDTAYNTYRHPGLPPGPIDNPGIPSLRAAMHPAQTDYLYFVATGDNPQGHSVFSTTLDQQSRNVRAYRKAVKQAGAQ